MPGDQKEESNSEDREIQFNKKKYLRELYHKKIEEFKKSDEETRSIFPVSHVFQGYSTQATTYTKIKKQVGKDGRIFIIKKNGEPISFTWETKPENIKKAVRYGIFKPESLTGQVIHAMGSYRATILERIYLGGIISNKYKEKKALLDFWEKRVELLQPIECLINSNKTFKEINQIFEGYIQKITEYKSALQENNSILSFQENYDRDVIQKLKKFLDDDIAAINDLKKSAPASLIKELPVLMIKMTKQIQGINQNLTNARQEGQLPNSLLRGKFNDTCEDVMQAIYQHEPDLHNAVLPEHQGDFSSSKDKKIYLEFSPTDTKALAAICQIEKEADKLECDEHENYTLKKTGTKGEASRNRTVYVEPRPLIVTKWTSWSFNSAFISTGNWVDWLIRIVFFLSNIVTGIILTPFDMVRGFFGGIFGRIFNFEVESWVAYYRLTPTKKLPGTFYSTIATEMQIGHRPFLFHLTLTLGQSIAALVLDIFKSAAIILKKIVFELPNFIKDDYYIGGRGDLTEKNSQKIMAQFHVDIQKIQEAQASIDRENKEEEEKGKERHFALPPYHLSPGEWEDIFNAVPRGLYSFVESVLHPIHVKNPMVGLIYNLFYFGGAFSVLFPDKMPLPEFYKNFSHALGEQMSRSITGQAISTAVTQGQGVALLADAALYGPTSILGKTFTTLEESIVDCVLVGLLARELGVLLKAMPGIGDIIEEETGKASSLGLITFGGKFGLVLRELLETGEAKPTNEEETHKFITEIKKHPKSSEIFEENKIEIKKTAFLIQLFRNTHALPFLPTRTKRELLGLSEKLFNKENPALVTAIENMLYPEQPRSIASRTIHIIADYLLILIRLLLSPFTQNIKQPWKDLGKKIKKDSVRVLRGLHKLGSFVVLVLYAAIYSPLRAISDIFFNGIIARAEGWIRGNRHSVSAETTEASSRISSTYQRLGDFIAPTGIYRNVTHRNPHVLVAETIGKDSEISPVLSSPSRRRSSLG